MLKLEDLFVSTGREYEWVKSFQGQRIYVDRDYRINKMSADLYDLDMLLTANNDRTEKGNEHIEFRVNVPVGVYVAYHKPSLHPIPDWLKSWTLTNIEFDAYRDRKVYYKEFQPGNVVLGANNAPFWISHYVVLVEELDEDFAEVEPDPVEENDPVVVKEFDEPPAILNIFEDHNVHSPYLHDYEDPEKVRAFCLDSKNHGCSGVSVVVGNGFFEFGKFDEKETFKTTPDQKTFDVMKQFINVCREEGVFAYFWLWGDKESGGSPKGGVNGPAHLRIQDEIIRQIGPIKGWGAGFSWDTGEFLNESQVEAWANRYKEGFTLQHYIACRGFNTPSLTALSVPLFGPNGPEDCYALKMSDQRPIHWGERFTINRWGKFDETLTRRHLYWNAMAGGIGSWIGRFKNDPYYLNKNELQTYAIFILKFFSKNMKPCNWLTNGMALLNQKTNSMIVYKQYTNFIEVYNCPSEGKYFIKAIDTERLYHEEIISVKPNEFKTMEINLPRKSDWAITLNYS